MASPADSSGAVDGSGTACARSIASGSPAYWLKASATGMSLFVRSSTSKSCPDSARATPVRPEAAVSVSIEVAATRPPVVVGILVEQKRHAYTGHALAPHTSQLRDHIGSGLLLETIEDHEAGTVAGSEDTLEGAVVELVCVEGRDIPACQQHHDEPHDRELAYDYLLCLSFPPRGESLSPRGPRVHIAGKSPSGVSEPTGNLSARSGAVDAARDHLAGAIHQPLRLRAFDRPADRRPPQSVGPPENTPHRSPASRAAKRSGPSVQSGLGG
jgi:hypothetical protein